LQQYYRNVIVILQLFAAVIAMATSSASRLSRLLSITVSSKIPKIALDAAPWVAATLCCYGLLNFGPLRAEFALGGRGFQGVWLAFYLFMYSISGLTLGLLLMSLSRSLVCCVGLIFVVIGLTNRMALDLLDLKILNKETADWLLSETAVAGAAISEFLGPATRHLAISIGLLLPLICVARLARKRLRLYLWNPVPLALTSLIAYGLCGLILYHYFKPFIPVESNLVFYAADLVLQPSPDVPAADLPTVNNPQATKIVLLVDETLTYEGFRTQLQQNWAKWNSVDFGEGVSLGNCSGASNSMLRWGFRSQRMLAGEDPRLAPTVWSYARKSGYETYLIDGQRNGSYQNYMRRKEAALIDQYIGVERGMGTDKSIAELLHTLVQKPGKMFIYVNKRGNHFPYTNNYPIDQFPGAKSREQQFAASVQYSNQEFLDTMLRDVSLTDVLIIYTSDHGERFDGANAPHCNSLPAWQEVSVPLLLLTGNRSLAQQAESAALLLKDRVGHEQIFATLLYAMGYDLHRAETIYGSSLLSDSIPQHYFHVSGNPIAADPSKPAVQEFSHFPYRDSVVRPAPPKPSLKALPPLDAPRSG
jgi:hypothetical protein